MQPQEWTEFRRNPPSVSSPERKICSKCLVEKSRVEFYAHSRSKDRLQYDCKECRIAQVRDYSARNKDKRRAWATAAQTKKLWGMTMQEYAAFMRKNGDKCGVCDAKERLCIDHCHTTGVLRGVLCKSCNLALGCLYDDPGKIRRLLAYIEESVPSRNM